MDFSGYLSYGIPTKRSGECKSRCTFELAGLTIELLIKLHRGMPQCIKNEPRTTPVLDLHSLERHGRQPSATYKDLTLICLRWLL
jgi:hypothetical protein